MAKRSLAARGTEGDGSRWTFSKKDGWGEGDGPRAMSKWFWTMVP